MPVTDGAGIHAGRSRAGFCGRGLVVADAWGEAAAFAFLVPLLLAPALWNGFPIIYYDTGAYVFEGLGLQFLAERSPVYSLFLRFGGAGISLWLVVLVQSALASFVILQAVRATAPRLPVIFFAAIAIVLVAATGLPWYVGEIEPDCFTGLVALVLWLLAFHADRLGRWRAVGLFVVGGLAVAVHPSHLLLGTFLLVSIALWRVLWRLCPRSELPAPRLAAPAFTCLAGLVLVLASNFALAGSVFLSRAGASFVFARMLQDGIVIRLLEDTCPKSGYRLCAWRNQLPATADGWLWTPYSPFRRLGRFQGTEGESARIVRDAMVRYPMLQLETAARDAILQFVRFGTGDQIEPQEWVLLPIFTRFLPSQTAAYLSARQQRGEIRFRILSEAQVLVGFLSIAGLIILTAVFVRGRRFERATFCGVVLAALAANAAICGILSGPHDRYQSRLVWLAPFAVMLVALPARGALQRRGESGTS